MKLVIGDKNLSSWSLRPWLALKMAQIPFEEIKVSLDQPDTDLKIAQYSPKGSGKVPVLIDGDFVIYESIAICEYVAERFPKSNLWPSDLAARTHARTISLEMHAGFADLRQQMPMHCAQSLPGKKISNEVQEDVDRITEIWSSCRKKYGLKGKMLFSDFSIADAMYAPVVTRFKTYGVKLKDPVAQEYADSILHLVPMKEWLAGAESELIK